MTDDRPEPPNPEPDRLEAEARRIALEAELHLEHALELELQRDHLEKQYRIVNAGEAFGRRLVRPPWLFEDFLLSQTLTLISADPFVGKSMLLLAMLASLDLGDPLFGHYHPTPGHRIAFFGQDAPTWDYIGQLQKLARALSPETAPVMPSNLILNEGFDFLDPDFQRMLSQYIEAYAPTVLMFDTLLEFHDHDENSNREMKPIMRFLKQLRTQHNLSILVAHHRPKPTAGVVRSGNMNTRGATVIAGSVDQHLSLDALQKSDGFRLGRPKGRGGLKRIDNPPQVHFVDVDTPHGPGIRLELRESGYGQREKILLAFLSQPRTRREVIAHLLSHFPDWTPAQAENRTANSLNFYKTKGAIKSLGNGMWVRASDPA